MSIIVKNPVTGQISLYCKGADSAILTQLAECQNDPSFGMKIVSLFILFNSCQDEVPFTNI